MDEFAYMIQEMKNIKELGDGQDRKDKAAILMSKLMNFMDAEDM